mgnify:CR=1 FL=1
MKVRLNTYIKKETYDYMKKISTKQRMTLGEITENGIETLQAIIKIVESLTPKQKDEFIKKMSSA